MLQLHLIAAIHTTPENSLDSNSGVISYTQDTNPTYLFFNHFD